MSGQFSFVWKQIFIKNKKQNTHDFCHYFITDFKQHTLICFCLYLDKQSIFQSFIKLNYFYFQGKHVFSSQFFYFQFMYFNYKV